MARYSIREFVERTAQQDRGQGLFEMESDRVLEVNLHRHYLSGKGFRGKYIGSIGSC